MTGDQSYLEFIDKNASSIWENDRNLYDQTGFDWAGPLSAQDQSFNASTLSSGLDALNAAAHVRDRRHPGGDSFEGLQ